MSGGVRALGVAAVVAVALLLSVGVVAAAWLPDYDNRVPITLTGGTSGAQTNYQLNLSITYDSDMQADFDDLRFTQSDGTTLVDAWLESKTDSTSAEVWVEFPTTPANGVDQTYYLYYKNAGAASDWDIGATFVFGDGFEGDLSKWSGDTASYSVSGGELQNTPIVGHKIIYADAGSLSNTVIEAKIKTTDASTDLLFGLGYRIDASNRCYFSRRHVPGYERRWGDGSVYYSTVPPQWTSATYGIDRIIVGSTVATSTHSFDGTTVGGVTNFNLDIHTNVLINSYGGGSPGIQYVDWIFVRKYAANPPTSSLGSEQYASDSILYNATQPYNHTISSDGMILINRSATGSTDTNWTAAAASSDSFLILTGHDKTGDPAGEFTLSGGSLDWLAVTNLSGSTPYGMKTGGSIGEVQTTNAAGEANFTTDISAGSYEIVIASFTPADPTGLANTTGNFWVNHTWSAGSGQLTDSYNVSVNDVWNNGTTATYNNTTYSAHAWQNITVWAYNSTGSGALSDNGVSQDTQIPNNPITITNTGDWSGGVGGMVSVDYDASDADSDTPVFSCNRTDMFTDFNTGTGVGSWTAAPGIYYVDFGVSDGWGSTDNYTMTITVTAIPPDPTSLANSTGNFWVNHTWSVGAGNVTDSYNVSVNDTWHNGTTNVYWNNTPMSPHGWSNISVYAYNTSAGGTLSSGSVSQDTQIPNNPVTITNVSDVEDFVDRNLFVDCDATDADSDAPTFSCNRTDLFTDFSTVTGRGNWTMVTGLYYVDFGVSDGYGSTNNTTIEILVKAALTPPPDIRDGVFGFRNASIPDNDTIDRYKADDILTVESSLDWDAITSGTWGTYKVSVLYCYDVNRRSGLRMSCDGDYGSATYIATVTDNITTYMPDLKADPYQTAVQFIAINLSNTTSTDKADFVNAVAQNISEQTDNKIKIVVLETVAGLEPMYVEASPVIYKALTSVSNWIDFEAVTLRGNSTKSRIYSGNESFMSDLSLYRTRVFSRMRNLHNTSDQYTEAHSVKVIGGDMILYNSGAAKANKTVASAVAGEYWDVWNDTLFNNTGGGTLGFWLDGESYTYVAREDAFEKITIQNNNSSLLGAMPTITEALGYYSNGSMTNSYLWGGISTDIKVELWDPTYIKDNLFLCHYEWINASWISNYSLYKYVVIADKNSNEITNTINRPNDTYGYISVADYTNTQGWIDGKKVEVDDWADNYSTNIFLDGIDFVVGGANFSARMKVLADYIMNDKDKSLILNTYTAYSDFATYGDAVMKESCFARWDGDVNSPTYSYEDMDIEKDRADYYTSHNIPVLGMSFGDVEDFDKMAYCAAAFAVLYGFDGDNCYRYGQPNFQIQKDINIYDFGNMLESAYTETSSTDWNRLYVAGRVHIDPVAHTWYIDDDKTVTNISVDIGLYSGAEGTGDRNIYLYANGNTTQHIIPYYPGTDPVGSWTERSAYLDADEHTDHGHYYIYFYTLRAGTGGWNFLGRHATSLFHPGRHSWYDETLENLPDTITGQTWNSLPRDDNWMLNMTVNYTTTGYVDELVDRITQGISSSVAGGVVSHTTVIESDRDCAIPVWGLPVGSIIAHTGATTTVNNSTGTWTPVDVDLVADASAGTVAWNYTTVDGDEYGAVREFVSTGNYIYRYLMPHLSTHEILTSSDTPTPPDPTGLANTTGNFWVNHTWSAGAGNITNSFNVSINDTWHNTTTDTFWNNTPLSPHGWSNATIYAYNVSGDGTLSTGSASQDTRIPNNAITITNTSDWGGEMGENVYVDYDATDADTDTPTFSCNRTDLFTDFSTADGTGNWTAAPGVHHVNFGVSDGWGSTSNYTMTISANATPPDPVNLQHTTGNFWVNHTWSAGAGNVTDLFNISVNSVWTNGTAVTSNNTTYSAHAWQNITIYAYNTSADGTLSTGSASQDTRVPNNAITITNTSDWSGEMGENVYVDYDATDADSDTPTFSCNRTDLFTDFSTADGTGNWTAAPGIYYVDFGVSDGYGSTDNYTMTISANATPPDPTGIANTTGNFWANHTWSVGAGNVTDSYNVSVNSVWHNATATPHRNNTGMSPHGWSNVSVYAYNASGAGTLSAGSVSQNTRLANNPVTITNTSDWSGEMGGTVQVNYTASDPDYTDTHTFSCNRTDLFTDFSASTGSGNWTSVAGTYYVDFGVSDGWGSTDNYTMTISATSGIPEITLVSFTPDALLTNYTGFVNVSFGVSHNDSGLNLTSLAFLYGINYTVTGNYNNSVRAPANEICAELGGHGKLVRGHNRNATPYLTWEFNDTITGGDIYTWGGADYTRAWITTNVINSTYTFINISENVNKIFPNMAYLGRNSVFEAEKTGFAISKSNSLVTKMWDVEELNGRTNDFYISMYFDTDLGGTSPSDDIIIWWCNDSYDPMVDDYATCPFCAQLETWNVTRWMDHEYVPHANASYAKPLVLNTTPLLEPAPDESNYIIFASNTVSSKPYLLNVTNADPGITNLTFAQTETCWDWSVIGSISAPYAYTPSIFYTFVRDYEDLEIQLYVAGNNSLWGASGIHNKSIGLSQYPVGPVNIEYFNMTCPILGYTHDAMMDATYDSGHIHVGITCPGDPDGGSVTHNLTLHYLNQTLAGIINNTFTTTGTEEVEINFTTSPYYSTVDLYTLKCMSTDEQGSVATKWLDSYFTLAADGTQGWVINDMLLFWGMNNIPTLYATVNNSSLISYDAGGDIYTMHVPFFKSKCNDTFRFNETVHLESLNTEDVAYFRFAGATLFDNATVHGWNTTSDTIAPSTDAYRGYLFSCCRTCGNMTNCNMSYLGSDIYRQEGLNFVNNPMDYWVYNTTMSHNSRGVILESCTGMTLSNCTVTDNEETGIGIYFTNNTIVENCTVTNSGYDPGIYLYEASNSIVRHNDIRDIVDHGIQIRSTSNNNTFTGNDITGSGGYDYYFRTSSINNLIIDPESATDMIRVTSTAAVTIRNTDNQVFAEDSLNTTYAYPANFSMAVTGVTHTFNITPLNLTATPATDRIALWNASVDGIITFNATNNTANPQVWFNVTKAVWQNSNITVYRDDLEYYNSTADANGFFPYNYTGGWSEHWFEFSPANLAPDKPSLVAPANGATGQSTNPTLQVTVTDPDLDTMSVRFYQQGGSQIGSTQTGIASGATASVIWSGRSYSTLYYWYAVADDGNATTQSDIWHFTTQSSGGSHAITINDCNNRNTPEGGLICNDFNYTNADPDAPIFTTNATEGSLDSGTGIFSWTTGAGDEGIYTWWFRVSNAYGNSNTCTVTFTVTFTDIGDPTNLQHTTGNFWVRHTWDAGIKTDSFNVSVNSVWHNTTTNEYWNNTPMSPHGWSNISIAGYNATTGNISSFISEDTQIPNNPVTITNGSDWDGATYALVTVDYDSTDADSDTPTYSCSRMDLFTNFNTSDGTGNWTATPSGVYTVDFGVSDGYGSTSNYTMRIAVGAGGIQTETKIPVSIFIALLALMFCLVTYVYYAKSHISRIFTTLIAAWMAFMLSQMIVSGNVVRMVSAIDSTDTWVHDTVAIQIPGLSYLLLFIAVILSIFLVKFVIMFGLEVIREAQREDL